MATQRQLTCEERIDEKLTSRIDEFREALEENGENEDFDLIDWLNDNALAYEKDPKYRAKRLELSWGGPADGFIFFEDGDIVYYFQDWFDGAERELDGEDYNIMREFYDYALNY